MTSRERLLCALAHKTPDRVPVSTYELVALDYWEQGMGASGGYDVLGNDYKSWYHRQPSYRELLSYLAENTDCFYMWFPDETRGCGKFLDGSELKMTSTVTKAGNSTFSTTVIETPKGPLSMSTRTDAGVNTVWETEHLLKEIEDIDRLLSLPYEPYRPDLSSYAPIRERLGERGVMLANLGDPLLYAAELFGFTEFTVLAYTERRRIQYLLDAMSERVTDQLRYQLDGGVSDVYRIVGPEYATAPYLPTECFVDFVARYDAGLIELIHSKGAVARLHSHGRVGPLLELVRDMGADALDPVEAVPCGDVTLADAKRRIGREVCLCGNIQLRDLELLTEGEIVETTKRAIEEAMEGGGFILMPTASPINEPISPVTERNYRAFVETALRYGVY